MADAGWGGMNRGTFRMQLTGDMLRLILNGSFNEAERAVICEVIEKSWGQAISKKTNAKDPWPDPLPCSLNLSTLAKETGTPRPNLSRAKNDLIRDRILIANGDGWTLNKNADEWPDSRISKAKLEHARSAQSVQHPRNRKSTPVAIELHPPVVQELHPPVATQLQTVATQLHPCSYPTTPPVATQLHPPSDPVRFKTGVPAPAREDVFSSLPELNSKNSLLPTPTPEPKVVGGGGGVIEREGIGEPGKRERLRLWVIENFGADFLPARKLNALLCRDEPEEWIRSAIREAAGGARKDDAIVDYARTCLNRWKANGAMDDGPARIAAETVKLTPNEKWNRRREANIAAGLKAWPKSGTVPDVKQG